MLPIDLDKFWAQWVYNPKEPLIFSSGLFLYLFCGFMLVYSLIHKRLFARTLFVTAFSLFFYYKSSGIYFLLLVSCTLVDFTLAQLLFRQKDMLSRRILLFLSLLINLGVLIFFKYTNFFYELYCQISANQFEAFDIFLPVGVSFFTFQSMSYTIDVYRGNLKPLDNILDYAFYLTFFPQLVAGPIVRAVDFVPQIRQQVYVTKDMFSKGIYLILTGLAKKVIIADFISVNLVDRIFENPALYSGFENLLGVYGYAIQIYCDFSGYSDMAIGIALLLGFHFNPNFNAPYISQNITEFWRRWHISLSSWLKDYLYISLGGNRKGKVRTYFNLLITMVLGGLWHGAALRFLLWGALHGIALAIHKFLIGNYFSSQEKQQPWQKLLSIFLTFHFVCFCWIFFRAESMEAALQVLGQIVTHFNLSIVPQVIVGYWPVISLMLLAYLVHFLPLDWKEKLRGQFMQQQWYVNALLLALGVYIAFQFKQADVQPFIYFSF